MDLGKKIFTPLSYLEVRISIRTLLLPCNNVLVLSKAKMFPNKYTNIIILCLGSVIQGLDSATDPQDSDFYKI